MRQSGAINLAAKLLISLAILTTFQCNRIDALVDSVTLRHRRQDKAVTTKVNHHHVGLCSNRREMLTSVVINSLSAATFGAVATLDPATVLAFENRISNKYNDRPKQGGSKPSGLGVANRQDLYGEEFLGLKNCDSKPHCFCSTMSVKDDPDHSIPPFVWPENLDQSQALDQLHAVLQAYPPGQDNVDGGGFEIKTYDKANSYIYVQYESLKNGYIDDVEFAIIPGFGERQVQLRSSSRIGYLDYGVNSKRINWIAKALREKGWEAEGVDYKKHANYALENQL